MMPHVPKAFYETRLWHRFFKPNAETGHWMHLIDRISKWYEGKEPFLFPYPTEAQKVKGYDPIRNALLTYIRVENENGTYLRDLGLSRDAFEGMRVADIGSGPLPTLLVFDNCERYCIDPLLDAYHWFGFPLDDFADQIHYINAPSENIPLPDDFFDAVISRDALDHVADFHQTAREIRRVLKRKGIFHVSVNYHEPTQSEPLHLNDEKMHKEFEILGARKVAEFPNAWGFEGGKTVLWSNLPEGKLFAGAAEEQARSLEDTVSI